MGAAVSLCSKCSMPIGDSSLYIRGRIYHHECSPYTHTQSQPDAPLNEAISLLEAASIALWKVGENAKARAIDKFLRAENIRLHGWPKQPLMDADGDIVHPPRTSA